jgi:hypothetical protein
MPYDEIERLPRLRAYLGANGVITSELRGPKDAWEVITGLFELEPVVADDWKKVENYLRSLGHARRRALVRKNLKNLPARFVSTKDAHRRKRLGVLTQRDVKELEKTAREEMERAKWERR